MQQNQFLSSIQNIFSGSNIEFNITRISSNKCNDLGMLEEIKLDIDPYEKTLELSSLTKCGDLKGTQILENIIKFAKDNNFVEIKLIDASTFDTNNCKNVYLASLNTLTNGMPWYCNFGFVAEDGKHDEYIEKNNNFINQNFDELKNKEKYPILMKNDTKFAGDTPYLRYNTFFKNKLKISTENKTIKEVFNELKNKLKTEDIPQELCYELNDMITLLTTKKYNLTFYPSELVYKINNSEESNSRGGNKCKTKKHKKYNKSKTKKHKKYIHYKSRRRQTY